MEDDYDGPRLSEDGITKEFVEELIERFKNQKKIHKRYAYKVNSVSFLISFNLYQMKLHDHNLPVGWTFFQILLEVKKIFEKQLSMIEISIPEVSSLIHVIKSFIVFYSACYISIL